MASGATLVTYIDVTYMANASTLLRRLVGCCCDVHFFGGGGSRLTDRHPDCGRP